MMIREEIAEKKMIDAAVNIIMTKMDELRGADEEDKKLMRRRWIWELIQNAADCSNDTGVVIRIDYNKDQNFLKFSHNGDVFTYENLIDLITQISSKRDSEENKVGKFGTGFISTHLISEIVNIEGYYHEKEDSKDYGKISLKIDRSGKTGQEIKTSIQRSISELSNIRNASIIENNPDFSLSTTSFIYDLSQSSKDVYEAIESGFKDLDETIPYVLTFSDKIRKVHCNEVAYELIAKKDSEEYENIKVAVCKKQNFKTNKEEKIYILLCCDEQSATSIAAKCYLCNVSKDIESMQSVPKLFCTFPLIGTENFAFPVVVNSPMFKVLQERNSIQEGDQSNKNILDIAVRLYLTMIEYVSIKKWDKLYNMCYMDTSKSSELQKNIKNDIKCIYLTKKIVPVDSMGDRVSLFSLNGTNWIPEVYIPMINREELSDEFWHLCSQSSWNKPISKKECYKDWYKISPENKVDIDAIRNSILSSKTIDNYKNWIKTEVDFYDWINRFYYLWFESVGAQKFKVEVVIPNQNGEFVEINNICIDDNIDEELKTILTQLEENIRDFLVDKNVTIPDKIGIRKMDNVFIANKICSKIRELLSKENSGSVSRTTQTQNIYNQLTDWFLKNSAYSKDLFKDIYEKQHLLSSHGETIRRLELASTVENAMDKNDIQIDQLNVILNESGKLIKMYENGEITLSEEAKKLFEHISSKSPFAKDKLDKLINRSIRNVYDTLSINQNYSIDDTFEEWERNQYSRTVFPAKKCGKDIIVVIRPSDDNKIIFYEDTEIEALDDTEYELWTDNGNGDVRMITMGDIIKTTGISVIPLRKIIR